MYKEGTMQLWACAGLPHTRSTLTKHLWSLTGISFSKVILGHGGNVDSSPLACFPETQESQVIDFFPQSTSRNQQCPKQATATKRSTPREPQSISAQQTQVIPGIPLPSEIPPTPLYIQLASPSFHSEVSEAPGLCAGLLLGRSSP
ncbi:hypothetical protein P7K49_018220 [Saguinus oedipus]|uniref:Uncharacterized protein n=1 Tax=Saguinus oedipus TaxID=9490 RepID=A0ABQ9V5Y7_SAGOE|nr:hypothetical protein P7K49_018220 [Saguinus oedipus]